jgi:hypothetical protein
MYQAELSTAIRMDSNQIMASCAEKVLLYAW